MYFTEKEKEYIKQKCDEINNVLENTIGMTEEAKNEKEEELIRNVTGKIFNYTLKNKHCTEDVDDTYDEDEECAEEPDSPNKETMIDVFSTVCPNKKLVKYMDKCLTNMQKNEEAIIGKFDNPMFGTELEYGGRGEYCRNGFDSILETAKHDGSVAGSGREYNMKPKTMDEVWCKKSNFKTELEKFMLKQINEYNCTESVTAGEHVHYSYKGITESDGDIIKSAINEICIEVADRNIPYWQTYTFRKKFEDYEKAQERKVDI